MPAPAANSRTPRIASQSPEPVRRKGLICLRGGPRHGPPHPPTLGASRETRDAPRSLARERGGPRHGPPHPPTLGRAPAQPWRASGLTQDVSSPCLRRARAGAPGAAERQPQRRALPAERVAQRLGEIALVGEMDLVRPVHAHGDGRRADAHLVRRLDFFFSSRRRHTRSYGDWSSDVCSSDLGSGDDLLIAGFTDFDANVMALMDILAEWSRTDLGTTYDSRIMHLRSGGGLNGGTVQIGRASCRERV